MGGTSTRPPWVRPARKKTPSTARSPNGSGSSPSHHGSPEDFATSDAYIDLTGNGGQSPRTPGAQAASSSGAGAYSPSSQGVAQVLSQSYPAPTGPASFLDSSSSGPLDLDGMDGVSVSGAGDAALAMSPQEIMALFGESSVDMSSLLMSPSDLVQEARGAGAGGTNGGGGGFYGSHGMVSP